MELNLSRAERELLRRDLCLAEPYNEDDPVVFLWDGEEGDPMRWRATIAKKLLEQDEREKAVAGHPLEPESTPESERRRRMG